MGGKYQSTPKISTNSLGHSKRREIPLSEKFYRRGQAKVAKGEDATAWFKASEIAWRIENDLPVGNLRRRAEKWLKARRAA